MGKSSTAVMEQPKEQEFSNARPIWIVVLLYIATAGLYSIYWFYRNWWELKKHKGLEISPLLRTLGLFVPILNTVLFFIQFKRIEDYAKEVGVKRTYSALMLTGGMVIAAFLWRLPDPYSLIALVGAVPIALVQAMLNEFWLYEKPILPIRKSLTTGQIVVLAISAFFWVQIIPKVL